MRNLLLLIAISLFQACGQPVHEASVSQDIGTDLSEDGKVRLYVVDGERIVRGTCRDYTLRSSCREDVQARNYAAFKAKVRALAAEGEAATIDQDLTEVFRALEGRIIYTVQADNQIFLRYRPYVKLFDQAFASLQ